MLRSRVRRSFTVEVKSKTRQSLSWPETSAPSPVNWAALDPAPETPSPFEPVWSDQAATPTVPPVAAEKPRRILQSLIVPEPEPDLSEAVIEREPRLPRVRRAKPPLSRTETARTDTARADVARTEDAPSDAIWSFADILTASADLTVATHPVEARSETVAPMVAPARKMPKPRAAEPVLAPGERWKRRLPRSLR